MVETKVETIHRIQKFWDDEHKDLDYHKEPFNDQKMIDEWRSDGYMNDVDYFTGQDVSFQ